VSSVTYENDGFGAVLNYATYDVLVWKNGTTTYDDTTGDFLTISEVDPKLASNRNFRVTSTFDYKDANGTDWIVAALPFFDSTSYVTGETVSAFVMLVFQKKVC
jgi:hypothetical protein